MGGFEIASGRDPRNYVQRLNYRGVHESFRCFEAYLRVEAVPLELCA